VATSLTTPGPKSTRITFGGCAGKPTLGMEVNTLLGCSVLDERVEDWPMYRFVVIDDIVWASGPSFNELGERIGLISRVHESRSVIAAIERALLRSKSLADWIHESELDPQAGGRGAAGV
jgi:hypothetical protein